MNATLTAAERDSILHRVYTLFCLEDTPDSFPLLSLGFIAKSIWLEDRVDIVEEVLASHPEFEREETQNDGVYYGHFGELTEIRERLLKGYGAPSTSNTEMKACPYEPDCACPYHHR